MKKRASMLLLISLLASGTARPDETNRISFSFGAARAGLGCVPMSASAVYTESAGFGFEPGATLAIRGNCLTSEQPFLFSVRVGEGNYCVRITLGREDGPSCTTVKAEARRLMLENVKTAQGEIVTREIMVSIRTPRIREEEFVRLKDREKETERITWDDKLTLEFSGSRPCLRALEIVSAPGAPTIFLAGDSTVCDQPHEPWNSWGQMLPRFFKPAVAVANYAQSGESIRSSLAARRFEKIFSVMKPGDWLFVQFGHNDMKNRAGDALAGYQANLARLIVQTRDRGATPVLITSMERKAGVKGPTLAGYPDAVRAAAREQRANLIDLNAMSLVLYRALGTNLDRAFQDGTHHNNYGSYELAKCVAKGVSDARLSLAQFLTEEIKSFDPAKPDAPESFSVPPSAVASQTKPEGN